MRKRKFLGVVAVAAASISVFSPFQSVSAAAWISPPAVSGPNVTGYFLGAPAGFSHDIDVWNCSSGCGWQDGANTTNTTVYRAKWCNCEKLYRHQSSDGQIKEALLS